LAIRVGYIWLLTLFSGCSDQRTARISDVTKPETITLKASHAQRTTKIFGIDLRVHGHIDGNATLGGKNVATQHLAGTFDVKTGGDWYSDTCQLEYSPTNVHAGNVEIEYHFRD